MRHLKHLFAVDVEHIVPLLKTSLLGRRLRLDPTQLDGQRLVLASHDDEAPWLVLLPLETGTYHSLRHGEVVFLVFLSNRKVVFPGPILV